MLQPRCKSHTSEELEFYCKECRSLACRSCVLSPTHRSHPQNMIEIDQALNEAQAVLKQYINKANSLLQGAENVMDNSARSSQLLQDNSKRAESKIQKYFHRMRCILTDREHYFVSILKRSVEEKKKEVIEKKAAFKVSMSGIIEGLKSLDDLSKRDVEDISILRDQGQVFEKLDGHMSKMSDNINFDSIEVDTSVTMPCFEDQNFERICRQVGDPGFRVSTQNVFGVPPSSPLSATPLLSPSSRKNTDISQPSAPPVPPRMKSNSVNTIDPRSNSPLTSPLSSPLISPTGSDISNGDRSQSVISHVPPPIPPKSPSHGKKRHPQWLEECKRQYEEEKAKDYEVPSVKQNGSQSPGGNREHVIIEIGRNGISKNPVPKPRNRTHAFLGETCPSVSPVPKARTKVFKPIEYNDHTVTVEAPTPGTPPLPVNNFTSSEIPPIEPLVVVNSKMMTGPNECKEDKICPYGVCIGSNYVIIVIDKVHKTARLLKGTGKFLDYIGKEGPTEGVLLQPTAVAADTSGNIYIVDKPLTSIPRILKYSETGKFLGKVVPKGLRSSILGDPQGIVVTHDGHLLVTDSEKSCIHVFDSTGKHEKLFGLPSHLSSVTFEPMSITLDNRGRVLVTDASNHVWMFTPDGSLLQHFGWEGQSPGDLYQPRGIAVNKNDQIIVSEGGNHRISVFTSSGSFVSCFGGFGAEDGQFNCPAGLMYFQNGTKLVIADEENCRLLIYDNI